MQKNMKIAAGSAAALAILVAAGLAVALPAQASTAEKSVSVVEPIDGADTDNVQDEVEDGTEDGETEDGTEDGETEDGAEGTSDDIGGVEVEDDTED